MSGDLSARGISILCVEDHPVFREGPRTIIESEGDMRLVAQAASAGEAVEAFRRHQPDVTLLDVRLAGSDGLDALAHIRHEFPKARVLVLGTSDGEGDINRALKSDPAGYILKNGPRTDLLAAVRTVHAGGRYLAPDVAIKAGRASRSSNPRGCMSHRTMMNGKVLHIDLDGVVTLADLLGVVAEVRVLESELGFAPHRIVDLTSATSFDVGYEQFSLLANQRAAERPPNRYRIAFLTATDVGYGIARIYEAVGQHADVAVRRVGSLAEAIGFIDAADG